MQIMKIQAIAVLCFVLGAFAHEHTYYEAAYEMLSDKLDKMGDFFSEKFKDAADFSAKTPDEMRQRLKHTQDLLDAVRSKKDDLSKTATKQSKAALDKLNEWYDATAKYSKEAKDVSADKYADLSKRWDKQSSEMYKNGFDDIVKIAQQAKKGAKAKLDDAEPYYSDAYEAIKDALAKGSNWFGSKFQDAKDFSAKTPEELKQRMKDTQDLLEAVKAKKDVMYKNANKQSKAALDNVQKWYDSTAKFAKDNKDVAADKFDDVSKKWTKQAEEMYKNGFDDIVKISKAAKKTGSKKLEDAKKAGSQAIDDAEDSGAEYYKKVAVILKDSFSTLSDFFSARFVDVKDFLAHTPEDLRNRVKDTQELIETINSRKGEYYDTASVKTKAALDKLNDWYEVTKEYASEAADVSTDKFTDLNTRWTAKSEEMYGTGFDELIKMAQEAKKTIKKKVDEL